MTNRPHRKMPTLSDLGIMASVVAAGTLLLACPPKADPRIAGALSLGLYDGAEFTYIGPGGLEEVHAYTRNTDDEERYVYERVARRSGFVVDDATFTLEVTDSTLDIIRYYDCLTLCGELSEPVTLFPWPLDPGDISESTVTVSLARNGEDEGTREERHRVTVGEEVEVELPAGTFTGHDVLWTRTIDEQTETASLFFIPDVGFGSVEAFDGATYELSDYTSPPDDGGG